MEEFVRHSDYEILEINGDKNIMVIDGIEIIINDMTYSEGYLNVDFDYLDEQPENTEKFEQLVAGAIIDLVEKFLENKSE
jgi:hypothetical protein